MFERFKQNIAVSQQLIGKLKDDVSEDERQLYVDLINLLNRAVPEFLRQSSPSSSISQIQPQLSEVSSSFGTLYLLTPDVAIFNQISKKITKISDASIKALEKSSRKSSGGNSSVRPSFFRGVANSLFRNLSESTISSFPVVEDNVKSANMNILPTTYLALTYFFTMVSFFITIIAYVGIVFIENSYWIYFWSIFAVPLVVFFCFVYYPKTEADAVQKKISYELPFATIHMTAIAGSDIEPSQIFEIIASSKEYPHVGKEIQKVLVMIRVYGYDMVTALRNVASRTSNVKLSELLSGLATNIAGGGTLQSYLEKKAESYLLDYKLERKRYIDVASTFMDIYISILIAAPMVLMLMLIIMNVSGIGFQGFSLTFLMTVAVIGIAIVNVLFLIAINLKQPKV